MLTPATLEVARESILVVAVLGLAFLMMCHWDQRHGRTTKLDVQVFPPRLRFRSEDRADTNSATQRDGETAGEHPLPSPPTTPLTHESPRLRAVEQR
jgi:hypothetical protein